MHSCGDLSRFSQIEEIPTLKQIPGENALSGMRNVCGEKPQRITSIDWLSIRATLARLSDGQR
jgi:hypothetical protein